MRHVLVVDIGSTGTKATVWRGAEVVASSRTSPTPAEDVLGVVAGVEACLDELRGQLGDGGLQVDAVGFSTFGMALVGLDSSGAVRTFASYRGVQVFYPEDGGEPCVLRVAGEDACVVPEVESEKVGVPRPQHPSYAITHMLHPTARRVVHRWTTLVSYIIERWTGVQGLPVSYSEASWLGLLEWRINKWNSIAVEKVGLERLPRLADFNEMEHHISEEYQNRWTFMKDATLLLGIVDGAAATLAAAPTGELCVTIGTSAAVRVLKNKGEVLDKQVSKKCFVHVLDSSRVVIGGALTDGGSALDFTAQLLNTSIGDQRTLVEDESFPGSIVCLPFFSPSGERAPGWAGRDIPSAFVGATNLTTSKDFLVASVVGVALRLGEVINEMEPLLRFSPLRSFASGTALSSSPLWQSSITGVLNCELWKVAPLTHENINNKDRDDTSSRGIVMLALGLTVQTTDCQQISSLPADPIINRFNWLRQAQRRVYSGLLNSMVPY